MTTLRMLCAVSGVALSLSGCQAVRPDIANPAIKCEASHPVCHITVRVKACKVTVEPEDKRVALRPGGVQMLWTIRDSPGVNFATSGIVFKSVGAKGRPAFVPERGALARPTFAMHNSEGPGKYPYTINVVDNGTACAPHDPSIVNEM